MYDFQKLIAYAKDYLKKQPFDIVHDFEHHQLVVNNCLAIIEHEHLHPNVDALLTAAWWHDVEKSYETSNSADKTVNFLKTVAIKLHVDVDFAELCADIILQHSFRQQQTSLEGKILFDADKIEYVNDARIEKLVGDYVRHPGKYTLEYMHDTHDIWVDRIKKVPEKMHFTYSKNIFLNKLKDTESILEKLRKTI